MKRMLALILGLSMAVPLWATKTVVVLNVADGGSNNINVGYLCWLTTTSPIARPNLNSAWQPSGASTGPSVAELSALRAGTTIERQFSITVASGTPVATIESALINRCQGEQAYLNGIPGPGVWYGFNWDGNGWTQQ